MTEIDDLSVLFQQGPPLTGAQREHIERVQEFEKQELLKRMALVQFLAPILCTCSPWYDRECNHPPQTHCSIHGMLMAHPYTGQPVMPGMPVQPGMFTPQQPHDEGHDHDEGR